MAPCKAAGQQRLSSAAIGLVDPPIPHSLSCCVARGPWQPHDGHGGSLSGQVLLDSDSGDLRRPLQVTQGSPPNGKKHPDCPLVEALVDVAAVGVWYAGPTDVEVIGVASAPLRATRIPLPLCARSSPRGVHEALDSPSTGARLRTHAAKAPALRTPGLIAAVALATRSDTSAPREDLGRRLIDSP